MEIQRELGAIGQHLSNMDAKLAEVVVQTKLTNGRVSKHDAAIAVLQDRGAEIERVNSRVDDLEGRSRLYALAVMGPVAAAFIGILLKNLGVLG